MLEQKELDIIINSLKSVLENTEESILNKVDEKLEKAEYNAVA